MATYNGPFGTAQAERLLWRAGFGPRPGDVERIRRLGVERYIDQQLHPERRDGKLWHRYWHALLRARKP